MNKLEEWNNKGIHVDIRHVYYKGNIYFCACISMYGYNGRITKPERDYRETWIDAYNDAEEQVKVIQAKGIRYRTPKSNNKDVNLIPQKVTTHEFSYIFNEETKMYKLTKGGNTSIVSVEEIMKLYKKK